MGHPAYFFSTMIITIMNFLQAVWWWNVTIIYSSVSKKIKSMMQKCMHIYKLMRKNALNLYYFTFVWHIIYIYFMTSLVWFINMYILLLCKLYFFVKMIFGYIKFFILLINIWVFMKLLVQWLHNKNNSLWAYKICLWLNI